MAEKPYEYSAHDALARVTGLYAAQGKHFTIEVTGEAGGKAKGGVAEDAPTTVAELKNTPVAAVEVPAPTSAPSPALGREGSASFSGQV